MSHNRHCFDGALAAGLGLTEKKMRLTLHTDYALRVLIHVALGGERLTTIAEIARSFDISQQHLMKVVNDLAQKGYLETVRGRKGGIRLRRDARTINIGDVVRDTEDGLDVIGCLRHRGYCRIERVCVLRGALRDAGEAFLAVLDAYTLADLVRPHKALSNLLLEWQATPRRSKQAAAAN
jgi:Rrf2 family transcriptional regulator, nitric oxide-sensitive transcriptional repressor